MTQNATQTRYRGAGIREQLDATTRALAAAHDHTLAEAIGDVRWERRGLLQRLVRAPRA